MTTMIFDLAPCLDLQTYRHDLATLCALLKQTLMTLLTVG